MRRLVDWLRNSTVRSVGRSVTWIAIVYFVLGVVKDICETINGDTRSTFAKTAVSMVELWHSIPIIGTGIGALISQWASAGVALLLIWLLWVTRDKSARRPVPEHQTTLSESVKSLLPPPQKLDPVKGPEIIAKRKDSARILRELAEKMWNGIDILKGKRKAVKAIFLEVNRDVEKLCSERAASIWRAIDDSDGTIDTVAVEKIDLWIRHRRDWLLKEAEKYEWQANQMKETGNVY